MLNPYIEAWESARVGAQEGNSAARSRGVFSCSRREAESKTRRVHDGHAPKRALDDAARLEKISAADAAALPLFGVAYSLKDLVWTKDIRTTFGSKNYEHWHAPADAELAMRLANSGGILLGKTTTPEFGLRPTTEGGLCPPARNPWNLEHTAGGSSGGSASAVAAGLHPIAQGSDGGGSITNPAACCGIVGLKPSRGRITARRSGPKDGAGFPPPARSRARCATRR